MNVIFGFLTEHQVVRIEYEVWSLFLIWKYFFTFQPISFFDLFFLPSIDSILRAQAVGDAGILAPLHSQNNWRPKLGIESPEITIKPQ